MKRHFEIVAVIPGGRITVNKTANHAPMKLARDLRDKLGAKSVSVSVFSPKAHCWFEVCEVKP